MACGAPVQSVGPRDVWVLPTVVQELANEQLPQPKRHPLLVNTERVQKGQELQRAGEWDRGLSTIYYLFCTERVQNGRELGNGTEVSRCEGWGVGLESCHGERATLWRPQSSGPLLLSTEDLGLSPPTYQPTGWGQGVSSKMYC